MRRHFLHLATFGTVSLLLLAACSGTTPQESLGAADAATQAPSPVTWPTDTFAAADPATLTATLADIDTELSAIDTEGDLTLTADFVRSLASGDPDLEAVADAIARAEAAAIDEALAKAAADTGLSFDAPQSLGTATSPIAPPVVLTGGRGSSARVPAAGKGDPSDFGKLGGVNFLLAELFDRYLPQGAKVAGKSSDSETKDGVTVKVGFDVDMSSSGASTFGLSGDVKVEATPNRPGSGSAGFAIKATVDPCPAADGTVTLQFSASLSADIQGGAKSATRSAEIAGIAIGHVDGSAHLASVDLEAQHKSSGTSAAGKPIYVDTTFAYNVTGLAPGGTSTSAPIKAPTLNSESQNVDFVERNRVHQQGIERAVHFTLVYLGALQSQWRDGKCVTVVATSPGRVQPGAVTPIPVSVVHKRTGTQLSVPVDATLTGPQSIDPTRIEKAPGTVTHTASGESTSKATIELVSTSNRGIGRTTVTINVGSVGYTASGGGPRISVSGTVADLTQPFTLQGEGSGFSVVFEYTPTSPDGRTGTLVYSGEGGGATLEGTGTYTIEGDEGGVLTMTAKNQGCATPGGCRSNTENITLTPGQ